MKKTEHLVHLCSRSAWLIAQSQGSYQAGSLQTEGFIHLSLPEQILMVANAFYRDLSDPTLLWIDPALLSSELRWEFVGSSLFPHLYGPINLSAVISISELVADPDGVYRSLPIV